MYAEGRVLVSHPSIGGFMHAEGGYLLVPAGKPRTRADRVAVRQKPRKSRLACLTFRLSAAVSGTTTSSDTAMALRHVLAPHIQQVDHVLHVDSTNCAT